MSITAIGKKYGLHKSTASEMVKNRDQIEGVCASSLLQLAPIRMQTIKMDDADEILYRWFKQARAMSTPLSGTVLMEKTMDIARKMKLEDFILSCWLDRFKKHKGVVLKAICGELKSVDLAHTDERHSLKF